MGAGPLPVGALRIGNNGGMKNFADSLQLSPRWWWGSVAAIVVVALIFIAAGSVAAALVCLIFAAAGCGPGVFPQTPGPEQEPDDEARPLHHPGGGASPGFKALSENPGASPPGIPPF